ncbi:hypothetical protein E2C01_012581 [Portunus trituberculatus]|uniref:Secreted protein n=1 Tax=Portunus trituberculatus TaxID=210409 RepID=A0A5B7DEZ0_PORTR|nr:hypothetical protein [Portunus trituberculatus]
MLLLLMSRFLLLNKRSSCITVIINWTPSLDHSESLEHYLHPHQYPERWSPHLQRCLLHSPPPPPLYIPGEPPLGPWPAGLLPSR